MSKNSAQLGLTGSVVCISKRVQSDYPQIRHAGTGVWKNSRTTIKEWSYTAGFNYAFNDNLAMYGRYASGNNMPTLYSGDSFVNGATRLSFTEVGLRY